MKSLLLLVFAFGVVASSSIIDFLHQEKAHLKLVLHQSRAKTDLKLVQLFPELKSTIEALHGNIDSCYDQTISRNKTVNIFEDKLHHVIEAYFVSFVLNL